MTADDKISGIKACVFDAYGTLFDVHSAVGRLRPRLGGAADKVSALWRQKQLEYTWLRSLMQDYTDFWQITAGGLDYALEANGIDDPELARDLLNAYLSLSCYPEVPAMLKALNDQSIACGILSNGEPKMLASAVKNAGLDEAFAHVLSVDELGIFKPDPRVYQLACDRFDVPPEAICFMSSNAWDVAGAAHFGFQVCWVNRFGQPRERLSGTPKKIFSDLTTLASYVEG